MKAFKFACPVCGQHLHADADATGSQIECPTCFQKIVVPQAPAAEDGKLILSATQVRKPRLFGTMGNDPAEPVLSQRQFPWLAFAAGALVLCGVAAAFVFRGTIFKPKSPEKSTIVAAQPLSPADDRWKLDLTETGIPEAPVSGKIQGSDFICDRAYLQNGTLTLRQSRSGAAELAVNILLARHEEEWTGNYMAVSPTTLAAPKVTLRCKKEGNSMTSLSFTDGYAMKLQVSPVENGKFSGKIYLCTPDDLKSFVAGTFTADIKKPKPKK